MGIRQTTPPADIRRSLDEQLFALEAGIVRIMNYVGLQFVRDVRQSINIDTGAFPAVHKMTKREMSKGKSQPQTGDYLDQTAALRSSVAYFVLKDGNVIRKQNNGEKREGVTAAQKLLDEVPKVQGYQLIGVAGMDYASYVESHGFNVITSQSNVAIVDLSDRLQAYAKRKGGLSGMEAEIIGVSTALR